MNRLGLYFFALASILSIIDGTLTIYTPELVMAKHILLVFAGIVVGMFMLSNEREFMISGVAFIVAAPILLNTLGYYFSYSPIGRMVLNFVLFVAAAIITVGFKEFVDSISKSAGIENLHHDITIEHLNKKSFDVVWSFVILVAVGLSIASLLIEMFYDIGKYQIIIEFLDVVIASLFIVDLWILFEKAKTMKEFLTRNFPDILAAVPAVGFMRFFKIIRAVRLIKFLNGINRFSKFIKVSRTTKFFSDESALALHTKGKLPESEKKEEKISEVKEVKVNVPVVKKSKLNKHVVKKSVVSKKSKDISKTKNKKNIKQKNSSKRR
jgi:hypothetical protein